jgi:hypothetical protein
MRRERFDSGCEISFVHIHCAAQLGKSISSALEIRILKRKTLVGKETTTCCFAGKIRAGLRLSCIPSTASEPDKVANLCVPLAAAAAAAWAFGRPVHK